MQKTAARLARGSSNILQFYRPNRDKHSVKESDGPIFWREFETIRHKGRPVPKATLFNTRLAIDAMAITCSHDTFHNKVLFGFRGDLNLHKIDYLVGDVTE